METNRPSENLNGIVARMCELLEEYDHYDLTIDILAAWQYYQQHFFPEARFDCLGDIEPPSPDEPAGPEPTPDFSIHFDSESYVLMGEVKATLSVGSNSLDGVLRQVTNYLRKPHRFRGTPTGVTSLQPRSQDLLLIVPPSAAAALANHLAASLQPPPCGNQLTLCQFEVEDSDGSRTLKFNGYPLNLNFEGLRDSFLPEERRISCYLTRSRILIRREKYEYQRSHIIAASDGMLSSLGVLIKVLEALKDLHAPELQRRNYTDDLESPVVEFTLDDLLTQLRTPPYYCAVRRAELAQLFYTYAQAAPEFTFDRSAGIGKLELRKNLRFGAFRREEILEQLPKKHRSQALSYTAFQLARAQLVSESTTKAQRQREAMFPLLPLRPRQYREAI